tara:strand:+ start:224 stop:403 length:180 start_codon:yes stop_codon:yes gene_type:complete
MVYRIFMQFIPGLDDIWVAQLESDDPIYDYDNLEEAEFKAQELQDADPTGRLYKVEQIG